MNYLGHAYLSFDSPYILVGNMISDFVKGSSRFGYTANIQAGISLHRHIDQFTDTHPATQSAKEFFKKEYRLYSAPIVDVVYDHFLASDISIFNESKLNLFTNGVYKTLEEHAAHLPPRFAFMLTYMKQQNWLFHYRTIPGISNSLAGLVRRSAYMTDHRPAVEILNNHYPELKQLYDLFIQDVKSFAKIQFDQLTEGD